MPRIWLLAVILFSMASGCGVVGAEAGDAARREQPASNKAVEGNAGDARESLSNRPAA